MKRGVIALGWFGAGRGQFSTMDVAVAYSRFTLVRPANKSGKWIRRGIHGWRGRKWIKAAAVPRPVNRFYPFTGGICTNRERVPIANVCVCVCVCVLSVSLSLSCVSIACETVRASACLGYLNVSTCVQEEALARALNHLKAHRPSIQKTHFQDSEVAATCTNLPRTCLFAVTPIFDRGVVRWLSTLFVVT